MLLLISMKKTFILLAATFFGNMFVTFWSKYDYYHVDKFFHFLGGFFVAMFFYYYLEHELKKIGWFKSIVILVSTAILVGVLWEFWEYSMDRIFHDTLLGAYSLRLRFGGDLTDTLGDLFLDIIGAIAFSISHLLRRRNSH